MHIHYNAFISYRHHPDDIRVATEIHRSLERFNVPKNIRKKYGKIDRLFRDKEELPITSDLNDDIDEALKNSDYLIVICSVHTKESIWVQREIELFLKTHHRSKVLTVLASGEPYDVIPDILLHEDVTDPVTGEVRRIDIEPLSCDWRSKRRKTRQEELLRLAAPLLGCAYDELRQRKKQYQARRNMIIISSALAASLMLSVYFLYTSITIQRANVQIQQQNDEIQKQNVEIQKQNEEIQAANVQIQANLDESLINQSRHLATAALERLSDGDRLTAISLAAAALPGQNNVRPYVPEAQRVLTEALGIYSTAGEVEAVGTVSPGVNILVNRFCVSDSEKVLYLYDQRDIITVWDTATLQKLGEFTLTSTADKLLTLNNDNLLVHNGLGIATVSCWQPDGTLLWQMDHCEDMTYLSDQDLLLLICETEDGERKLLTLSGSTGEDADVPLNLMIEEQGPEASAFVTTPNAALALIRYYNSGAPMLNYAIDLVTGIKTPVELLTFPEQSVITGDGYFVGIGGEDGLGIAATVEGNRVTTPGTRPIFCYDLRTGDLLWENAITTSVGDSITCINVIPENGNLLCACGNIFMILDAQTGETIAQCGAGSGIKSITMGQQFATAVLQDGYLCRYYYGSNYCYEIKCMKNGVDSAFSGTGCYSLHWQEDHVTVYQTLNGTPAWASDLGSGFSVSKQKNWGQYLAFRDSRNHYLFDTETQNFLYIFEKGQKELLGFSVDGTKLWFAEGRQSISSLEIATGNWETLEIIVDEGPGAEIKCSFAYFDDHLYYILGGLEKPVVVVWDLNTRQKTACPLQIDTQEDLTYWSWEIRHAEGQYLWLWRQGKMLLEANLNTGKTQYVIEGTSQLPVIEIHTEKNLSAVANLDKVYLKTPGMDTVTVIELDGINAGSLCFRDDDLLVLCDNGFIHRYDLSGNLLSSTELWVSSRFGSDLLYSGTDFSKISWQFTNDNKLIVNTLGEGNVIDCETWTVTATFSNFLHYDEASNCLVCKVGTSISGYPLYDTAALLELAEAELGNFQMTPEQKAAYGIDS